VQLPDAKEIKTTEILFAVFGRWQSPLELQQFIFQTQCKSLHSVSLVMRQ
jgi:hypothetical protein